MLEGICVFRRALLCIMIACLPTLLLAQEVKHPAPKLVKPLEPLLAAFSREGVSGSLELAGRCDATRFPPNFGFPHWNIPATSDGGALEVARETLTNDPSIRIAQDSDRTVRMIEAGVPTDLLNVKIKHISFESSGKPLEYGAFTANEAVTRVILRAPEIVAFMKDHGIKYPTGNGEGGSWVFGAKRVLTPPNMSGSMDDLTLSEALDRVLRTFGGIWIYEDCPAASDQKRTVFFRFANLKEELLIED